MADLLSQFPRESQVIDRATGWLVTRWQQWLVALSLFINSAVVKPGSVSVLPGVGAVVAVAIPLNSKMLGAVYRVSYSLQTTRAASVSSNLQITIGWTSYSVAQSQSGAAIVNGTNVSQQSGQFIIQADANTDVTYAVTYASVGGTSMQYALELTVERLE